MYIVCSDVDVREEAWANLSENVKQTNGASLARSANPRPEERPAPAAPPSSIIKRVEVWRCYSRLSLLSLPLVRSLTRSRRRRRRPRSHCDARDENWMREKGRKGRTDDGGMQRRGVAGSGREGRRGKYHVLIRLFLLVIITLHRRSLFYSVDVPMSLGGATRNSAHCILHSR